MKAVCVLMEVSSNDSLDDALYEAQQLTEQKKMPVRFLMGGYYYQVEQADGRL